MVTDDEFEIQKALGTLSQYFVDILIEYDDNTSRGRQVFIWAGSKEDACKRAETEVLRTIPRKTHIKSVDSSAMIVGEELPLTNDDGTPFEIDKDDIEVLD